MNSSVYDDLLMYAACMAVFMLIVVALVLMSAVVGAWLSHRARNNASPFPSPRKPVETAPKDNRQEHVKRPPPRV